MTDAPAGDEPPHRAELRDKVARLPRAPGVYIFRNEEGAVSYVGKARSLRDRVRSYFTRSRHDHRRAVRFVDRYVRDIEVIVTATEHEAFLLENKLVKRHKPAYNVKLRDDKDFLYVRVDRRHDFPALRLARRPKARRGAGGKETFHGPFASAQALRRTLRMLGGVIPLRDCTDREFASRTRPCLKHEMGRCSAPCVDLVGKHEYGVMLDDAIDVLEGRCERIVEDLEQRMERAAADLRFEEAARHRDHIRYLRTVTSQQEVENLGVDEGDVVGLSRAGGLAEVVVLFVRNGSVVSSVHHTIDSVLPDEELVAGFVDEFYADERPVPRELLLPVEIPEADLVELRLREKRDAAVGLSVPQRGAKRRLIDMATRNAEHSLAVAIEQRGHQQTLLESLQARLELPRLPERIECYDISNTGRTAVVASRVVFQHGEPERSRYRSYKMKTLDGQDDFGAMREVLGRRFARAKDDPLPDLLVVDGGASHLAIAVAAAAEAEVDVPLASLAKGGRRGQAVTLGNDELERVFLPGRDDPIALDRNTPEEYLLQRLRDEAHRFAIGHHRRLRSKTSLRSTLDDVPGVGPVLKKRLLQQFGGTRALERATVDEVASVKGVSRELASTIVEVLSRN